MTTTSIPPASAVSASFVSPSQGFALELSGKLVATTDGGNHWHAAGYLPQPSLGMEIRFIDATDGFAFARESSVFRITHDAGATWLDVDRPFTTVDDLAISRGTVYAVGTPRGHRGSFALWSAPATHLVWKRDPLPISARAGPVPEQTFAVAGGAAWMVNEGRFTVAGGRVVPGTTRWTAWTPPCVGAAEIAASTATDIVAVCHPSVALDQTRSTIAFSQDGGATFGPQRAVPGSTVEGLLSPEPGIAVVVTGTELRRTTDGGATWHVVARQNPDNGGASDFGFTTTTEGFVAFSYDPLLITHDAGATWQPVTLP